MGDIALLAAPMGDPGQHNEAEDRLEQLAAEAGIEPVTLGIYRQVAWSWPPTTRVVAAVASWSVYRELMSVPGRAEVLRELAAADPDGHVTVKAAREWREQQDAPPPRIEEPTSMRGSGDPQGKPQPARLHPRPPTVKTLFTELGKAARETEHMRDSIDKVQQIPEADRDKLLASVEHLIDVLNTIRALLLGEEAGGGREEKSA